MEKITIDLIDEASKSEIKKMDRGELIKLLKSKKILASEYFKNSISPETAKKLHKHVEESRAEWDRF